MDAKKALIYILGFIALIFTSLAGYWLYYHTRYEALYYTTGSTSIPFIHDRWTNTVKRIPIWPSDKNVKKTEDIFDKITPEKK